MVTTDRLTELAARARAAINRFEERIGNAMQHSREAGQALVDAKAELARRHGSSHGRWLAWLKENVGCHRATACRHMNVAREWAELTAKCRTLQHFDWRRAHVIHAGLGADELTEAAKEMEELAGDLEERTAQRRKAEHMDAVERAWAKILTEFRGAIRRLVFVEENDLWSDTVSLLARIEQRIEERNAKAKEGGE